MAYWVQYFHTGLNGKTIEMCGNDGVFLADGRFGRTRVQSEAIAHAHMVNERLGKGITHFQLMSGTFSTCVAVGPVQKLREKKS